MNLSDRIEAACSAQVGRAVDKVEARRWFASRLKVSVRCVDRWCDGTRQFRGPALACLEMMEEGS
jgi:DNA-binding transcriptional regulator YiaG